MHALISASAVVFGFEGLPIAPAVVLVAYAALAEPPIEAAISAAFLGFVLDALTGAPVGLNMLACVVAFFLAWPNALWVSSPRSLSAFLFAGGMSAGYFLTLRVLLLIFNDEPFGVQGLFTIALANGALALLLFPPWHRLLVRLGLETDQANLEQKLEMRTRRGKSEPSA